MWLQNGNDFTRSCTYRYLLLTRLSKEANRLESVGYFRAAACHRTKKAAGAHRAHG
jgi:hypothetical protein